MMARKIENKMRFNPSSPSFRENLYLIYDNLRCNQPLMRLGRTWVLSRYDDVMTAFKNQSLSSTGIPSQLHNEFQRYSLALSPSLHELMYGLVLFEGGEQHLAHRKALLALFSNESWQHLQILITQEAQQRIKNASDSPHIEGIRDIAAPLWGSVFARWLNLPVEQQRIIEQEKGAIRLLLDPAAIDEVGLNKLMQAMKRLDDTFGELMKMHCAGYESVFFRALVKGYNGDMELLGRQFSTDCISTLIGGSETSEALAGNLLHILAQNPQLQNGLSDSPSRMREIVLETMRFESPLQMARRKILHPMELHGRELCTDDNLLLCLGAANRDESVFENAEKFIPGRKNAHHQLGFGTGAHLCIGQTLATFTAGKIALELLKKYRIRPDGNACWQQQSLILRALEKLPLECY